MRAVHMNPEEAVQAHLDLRATFSIGMHFGTFQLTKEGIDEPLRALDEARRARSVASSAFRALRFGESAVFRSGDFSPSRVPTRNTPAV
jgi:L-ascorbate metabolism protein UlaG (beta-lactamase superfamily)